jgi:hypothetical protein
MHVTTCSRKNSMGCIQCVTQVLFVLYNFILIYSFWIWHSVHMYPLVRRWNCWVAPFSLPPISIQRFQNMYLSSSLLLLLFCCASTSQRSNNGNFTWISKSQFCWTLHLWELAECILFWKACYWLCSNFYLWPNKEIGLIWSKFEIKWKVWKIVLGVVSPRKGTCGFAWAFTLYLEKKKRRLCEDPC